MDKKLIIVLGVFLTVALCVAALHGGDDYHEEIPFKSIDDPDVQSQVLESIMENSDLVLTIETTDSVTIKPATVHHSVSYNTGITTVTIFDYIGQTFHVVVGDSSDVYLFGVTDKKEYDKENKTVTIINDTSKKPKMTIKLLSSEPDLTTFTEIFEVTNFEMYTPDSDLDFKARSVVQKGRNSVLKTEWFIEVNQSYVVNTTDYKATQAKKEVYNNKTGKNETIFVNETVISGYHDETRYRNVWSDYNKYGTKLAKNTIQKIKVVYHKKAELGDVRIQTVPVFAGVECEELTWWNTSWDYKIDNVASDGIRPYQFRLYISNATNTNNATHVFGNGHFNSNYGDIRCTLDNTTELEYGIVNDSVDPATLWINVTSNGTVNIYYGSSTASTTGNLSKVVTGGAVTGVDDYLIHNFTASGTFVVNGAYNVSALVVAGGGGGGGLDHYSGGGGAGGLVYTALHAVTKQSYSITIGAGGVKAPSSIQRGLNGGNSIFSTITSIGGGGGSARSGQTTAGSGGSGGGRAFSDGAVGSGTSGQGYPGGSYFGGGGGGASEVGGRRDTSPHGGDGGDGLAYSISGTSTYYSGGGGGGGASIDRPGGLGGGGSGGVSSTLAATDGTDGSGGGGGGGSSDTDGGDGGDGIVIIRYNDSGTWNTWSQDPKSIITEYTPATPLDKNGGESQLFTVNTSENSQCRWYINGSLKQTNSTGATRHEYLNSSLNEGYWNFTAVANTSTETSSQTWLVTVYEPPSIPPDPVSLTNTTGNFWIRHAWSAGSGNITDGYNVSVNDTWYNTSNTFINLSKSPHGYQNITVHAWNATGITTMSSGYLSENVTLANNPVTLTNYSLLYSIQEFDTVSIDFDYTDADGDVVVFGTNAVNGTFDNATGLWSWTTTWMDRSVNQWTFNVSDGYGSVDSITIEIEVTAYPITELSENWQYHDSDDPTDLWDTYAAGNGYQTGWGSSSGDQTVSTTITGSLTKSLKLYAYAWCSGGPITSYCTAHATIQAPSLTDYLSFVVRAADFTSQYSNAAHDYDIKIYLYDIEGYLINEYDITSYVVAAHSNDLFELTRLSNALYLRVNGDNKGIIGTCDEQISYIRFYSYAYVYNSNSVQGYLDKQTSSITIDDITTSTAINGIGVDHSDAPQYANTHTWADSELWTVPPTITTTYGLKTTPAADYTDAEYTMKVQSVLTSEYVNTTIIKPAGEAPNSTQKPCGSVSLDQPTLFGDNYGVYNFLIDKDGSTIATDYIYWMNMEVSGNSYINVANPTYPAGAQIVPSYFIDNINLVEYKYYIKTLSLFGTQMAVSSDLLVDTGTVSVDTTGYDATSYWCVLVRESRSDGVAVEMASDMFAITNSITIGGTVYDAENGTPLGDAKVALYQNGLWYNTTSNTTTGEYSLDDLTADVDISVNVTHPGYIHDDYTFTPLAAGVIPIDIYMLQEDPGITYTGTAIGGLVLYAPYHQALNGATANLWNSTWNGNTTSSSTGYYLFDDIANGTFTGNAAMSGYSSASNEDVTTSLGAYTYQNYLLQPLNILTVKAKDTSTHATIMTFSAVFEEDTTYETTDGFINITAGIGIYKVEVTAEGYYVGIDYATVVSDTELVLYLVPIDESGQGTYYDYHYVEFIVSDAGTRCAGVNTTVYLATNGTALQNGITGTNGGVVFELSEDVKYTLTFINESQSIDKTITLYPLGNLYYIYINESYTFDPGNVSTGLTNYSTTNTSRDWAIHNLTSHDLNSTIGLGILGQGIVASTVVWCIVGAGGPAAAFAAIAAMAALGIVTWILVLFCGMTAVSLYILGGKIR